MTETDNIMCKTRKYQVEIVETLRRVVTVEIPELPEIKDTECVAISIAQKMYRNEEIILDADDHVSTEFNLVKDNN